MNARQAIAAVALVITVAGCKNAPPPSTPGDDRKLLVCIENDLEEGILNPADIAKDCGGAAVDVVVDYVSTLEAARKAPPRPLTPMRHVDPPGP